MKAVAYQTPGPIDRVDALQDITLDKPTPAGRDLLVKVEAVSVNPVDTKLRRRVAPEGGGWRVLGFDAAGVVEAVGPDVEGSDVRGSDVETFQPGDAVYYAGAINRPGANSEYHLVDCRIAARRPASLTAAQAAALPLTAITAWEMLLDRLEVTRPTAEGGGVILVIGGAGGVGSITLQLLRALTDMTVIATASRPETQQWAHACGAHHVIDHRRPLAPQVEALGLGSPGFVFSTTQTGQHWADIARLIAPQGRVGLIDDPGAIDVSLLKPKAASLHWEFMFARPVHQTPDMAQQGRLLAEVARLADAGRVRTTLTEVLGRINAATLRAAHAQIETGATRGKLVLEGF
ncbi:MAG: zinc-binding alcohol dehydrogenase family protein [Planctomycetota bacterium]